MNNVVQVMMQLIKSEITGNELDKSVADNLSAEFLTELYKLSKSHDMTQLIGSALERNKLLPKTEVGKRFKKQIIKNTVG